MFGFEYGLSLLGVGSVDLTRNDSRKGLEVAREVSNCLVEENVLFEDAYCAKGYKRCRS